MKITSFNTLWHSYSHGFTSIRDQVGAIKSHITQEDPDVCCLLEMPNPHEEVNGENLLVHESLWELDAWLASKGYVHARKLNCKTLSVWVVSRTPLVPLLVLGASTVSGAISRILKAEATEKFIDGESSFSDCAAEMFKPDRSIVVGVVWPGKDESDQRVLPLIATHARCLYMNAKFGRLLVHLLRAMVAEKGVVVADFNIEPQLAANLDGADFRTELPTAVQRQLLTLPLAAISAPLTHTCISVGYPYQPLVLDYFLCKEKLAVSASSVSEGPAGSVSPLPNASHSSDHKWISAVIPTSAMLSAPAHSGLSRTLSYEWSKSHGSLFELTSNPLTISPAPCDAVPSRPSTPDPNMLPVTVPVQREVVLQKEGPAFGVIKGNNTQKKCGGILVDGASTQLFAFLTPDMKEGDRVSLVVVPNPRKPGEQMAEKVVKISGSPPLMPKADTAEFRYE